MGLLLSQTACHYAESSPSFYCTHTVTELHVIYTCVDIISLYIMYPHLKYFSVHMKWVKVKNLLVLLQAKLSGTQIFADLLFMCVVFVTGKIVW